MNCTTCDAPLEQGALFCANCGARVTPAPSASSAATPTIVLPGGVQEATPPQGNVQGGSQYPPQSFIPQPYPPQPSSPTVPNSNAAVISLVFGILSWVGLIFIGAIVAIIAGHMARNEIRKSGGQIGGSGMATAGLLLGYIHLGVLVLGCAAFFVLVMIGAASS
jgi:hypothetical protein